MKPIKDNFDKLRLRNSVRQKLITHLVGQFPLGELGRYPPVYSLVKRNVELPVYHQVYVVWQRVFNQATDRSYYKHYEDHI